ncbi:MAG: hypothetical protein FD180_2443, partial [Planctomycetota bacterium]
MRVVPIAIALFIAASLATAEPPKPAQPEKGGIVWETSYDQAKAKAAGEGKLLF